MDPEDEEFEKTVEWALKEEQTRLTRGQAIGSTKLIVACLVIFLIVALILAFSGRSGKKGNGNGKKKEVNGGNKDGEGNKDNEGLENTSEGKGEENREGKEENKTDKGENGESPDQYKALNMMKDPDNFYMDDFSSPPATGGKVE